MRQQTGNIVIYLVRLCMKTPREQTAPIQARTPQLFSLSLSPSTFRVPLRTRLLLPTVVVILALSFPAAPCFRRHSPGSTCMSRTKPAMARDTSQLAPSISNSDYSLLHNGGDATSCRRTWMEGKMGDIALRSPRTPYSSRELVLRGEGRRNQEI
ncbi:hypothetical protein PM082_022662 [Marasmius tenuissimus]|nr:hypothetical protein PM082_022662 [Marasmius tenuissimus]